MPAFPSESDLFPAGALAPATAKTKWQQFWQAATGLLGTTGDAADARAALGALAKAGDTLTGLLKFKNGADIASAATVNLSTATGNTVKITGTTGITAWTMSAGQVMDVIFAAALTLTHHATNNNMPGAANITTAAGDRARLYFDGTTVYLLQYQRADGRSILQSITATPSQNTTSGNAITFSSIPSWVNRITICFNQVSTNGTISPVIRIGTGGVADSTGYLTGGFAYSTSGVTANDATGFIILAGVTGAVITTSGTMVLTRMTGNTWVATCIVGRTDSAGVGFSGGLKTLSGFLDTVRLTIPGGTELFDAGSVNILYE